MSTQKIGELTSEMRDIIASCKEDIAVATGALEEIAKRMKELEADSRRYQWLKKSARFEPRDGGYTGFFSLRGVDARHPDTLSGPGYDFTKDFDRAVDFNMAKERA